MKTEIRQEKKLTYGPRDVVDISWAFFGVLHPPAYSVEIDGLPVPSKG